MDSYDSHYGHVVVPDINILRNDLDPDPVELRERAHSASDDSLGNNNIKHDNNSSSSLNGKANVAFVGGAGAGDDTNGAVVGVGGGGDVAVSGSSVDGGGRSIPKVRIISD